MDVNRKKNGFTPLEIEISNWAGNRRRKRFRKGFTLVEVLIVLGIIALLVGLLIPSLSMVRRTAREAKQKAQLITIDLALTAFKNDYGDYPPSDRFSNRTPVMDYCGAQKLTEALLGRDLLGFHTKSSWSATDFTYYPDPTNPNYQDLLDDSLQERRGPYLELATANSFKLGDLFGWGAGDTGVLEADTFVICDVFGAKPIRVGGKTIKAGTPILYYKANTSSKKINEGDPDGSIYNAFDNLALIDLIKRADDKDHPLWLNAFFYGDPTAVPPVIGYIQDPKVTARPWPYRPDSYILISAGADGLYGTGDDITNFGN